ncbi:glycerol-3-phosphate dehydrogenase (NAD(+)) [Vittaforma corneae ATCC 50505]|uniref:Glycerol-3-phosphate dehydrogenase [NAD(+)] n=1 Tax=Vittaforma corneae (strain ATCC 50505) TaxID=993615 RepID=L2GJD7_VITCO|nr:glycerol-3-phosphate dehydrogenase (NAD(+)) [Vittaforma corneae ATCC 50505]ELA40993.1 glycerol-3-phosphate dehydrogenase (NAD(+)) [Vittaforma corneae ATCC 50505]
MKKVAVIGNGNWGTTVSRLIANNITATQDFDSELLLWVHEEMYQHQKLSEYINALRTNPIYLPGVRLPDNIRAVTSFDEINEADIFVICLPCKFLDTIKEIKPKKGSFAINLSKGLILKDEKLYTPSEYIESILKIECASLCGANIAIEVATEQLSECTVGYTDKDQINCLEWMFDNDYFRPRIIPHDIGIEICAALKNIVSLGFGIIEGMEWGSNTKAMLFRKGLVEMERFCKLMKGKFLVLESCCIGDLLTSCLNGRNFRCGMQMAKDRCKSAEIEKKMGGQKLEGPETVMMINSWLEANNMEIRNFPVFQAIHRICFLGEAPEFLHSVLKKSGE